jgi:hypothetical protein
MAFADEPVDYACRSFQCGWSGRQQAAADIAARAQQLARGLGLIDPAFRSIRPSPMRKFRAGDPGPILDMTPAELTDRIERRGRYDPPRYPAPVSSRGYELSYRNDALGLDPSHLAISIRAGDCGPGWVENRVRVSPHTDNLLWRNPERGIQILEAMVQAWNPEWACAFATISMPWSPDDEVNNARIRPWLAWTAKPLRPRPEPNYGRPYPYPFPLDKAGPAAEVRPWRGGELRIWP